MWDQALTSARVGQSIVWLGVQGYGCSVRRVEVRRVVGAVAGAGAALPPRFQVKHLNAAWALADMTQTPRRPEDMRRNNYIRPPLGHINVLQTRQKDNQKPYI